MSNIIIPGRNNPGDNDKFKWKETPAEKSLRQKGHATRDVAILEGGGEFPAWLTRKEEAVNAFKHFLHVLQGMRNTAADHKWDDEKGVIVFGVQWRNNFEQDGDGEWHEMGSDAALRKLANKAIQDVGK